MLMTQPTSTTIDDLRELLAAAIAEGQQDITQVLQMLRSRANAPGVTIGTEPVSDDQVVVVAFQGASKTRLSDHQFDRRRGAAKGCPVPE